MRIQEFYITESLIIMTEFIQMIQILDNNDQEKPNKLYQPCVIDKDTEFQIHHLLNQSS